MTSRRVDVVGVCPVIVTLADIERMIWPAVGYGRVLTVVARGITTAFTVSPDVRFAVNAPCIDVPVVVSDPADVLLTVRCELVAARPVTTWLLDDAIVFLLESRRVVVPLTFAVVVTVFVVDVSKADCAAPAAVWNLIVRVTVMPLRVVGPQVTMPVALA